MDKEIKLFSLIIAVNLFLVLILFLFFKGSKLFFVLVLILGVIMGFFVYRLSLLIIKKKRGDYLNDERLKEKDMNELLKLTFNEMNQIFNIAADGMRLIDKNFNIIRVNDTFSTMVGIPHDEILNKKCFDIFYSEICHTDECPMVKVLNGEKNFFREIKKTSINGKRLPCIMSAKPFHNMSGEIVGIVEDFSDITNIKHKEFELKKINKELEKFNKIAVDRELRMIQLKKQIKELSK